MTQLPDSLRALAEAVFPLARDLAAGMLHRPAPVQENAVSLTELCRELETLLDEAVPALRDILADMPTCDADEAEELCDDLSAPALDLVEMARRIWESPFPPKAEGARPLLAALAEGPAAELLDVLLRLTHAALDPFAVLDDPAKPSIDFLLEGNDKTRREALARWGKANPGVLPKGFFENT